MGLGLLVEFGLGWCAPAWAAVCLGYCDLVSLAWGHRIWWLVEGRGKKGKKERERERERKKERKKEKEKRKVGRKKDERGKINFIGCSGF